MAPNASYLAEDDSESVSITLTLRELRFVRYAVRQQRKKMEREKAKSTFVPEPGRHNVNDLKINLARSIEDAIKATTRIEGD